MDYSSAFNTIVSATLVAKLQTLGLKRSLCSWILDFLTGRSQVVRMGNNTSSPLILNTGAPQGCVLSPLLYSLYTHDCKATHSSNFIVNPLLFGSQRRRSLSLPVLTLIFPALLPCLVRDSLCTALQTKILWINWSLNAIDTIETWVSGNLTALTERSQPAIRWRVGEVANRVSCGSFRGGH